MASTFFSMGSEAFKRLFALRIIINSLLKTESFLLQTEVSYTVDASDWVLESQVLDVQSTAFIAIIYFPSQFACGYHTTYQTQRVITYR